MPTMEAADEGNLRPVSAVVSPLYRGPTFQQVEEVSAEELAARGGFRARNSPLLVRGALADWPAMRWGFESLSQLRRSDGSEVVTTFQNGLIEQGTTRPPLSLAIAPYLRSLAEEAAALPPERLEQVGLLPNRTRRMLAPGESFRLDWSYLKTFEATRSYLAQWHVLDEFPELRRDMPIERLWPGRRYTWEFAFIGPANTVTGLHTDFPPNWFCQFAGVKEYVLFAPEETPNLCKSDKYDRGATLSEVDITRLESRPEVAERFARARGLYARVEASDALYIPSETWHAVIGLAPSISVALFGLTAVQVLTRGVPSEIRHAFHLTRLYRWGNCTCHGARAGRY